MSHDDHCRRRKFAGSAVLLSLTLVASVAPASSTEALDEIVVTATRRP